MTAYTTGAWWVWMGQDGSFEIWSLAPEFVDRFIICSRNPIEHRAEESRANARLLATAPELLIELEKVTDHLARVMGGPIMSRFIKFEDGVEGIPTIKAARAVIARAKGEPDAKA